MTRSPFVLPVIGDCPPFLSGLAVRETLAPVNLAGSDLARALVFLVSVCSGDETVSERCSGLCRGCGRRTGPLGAGSVNPSTPRLSSASKTAALNLPRLVSSICPNWTPIPQGTSGPSEWARIQTTSPTPRMGSPSLNCSSKRTSVPTGLGFLPWTNMPPIDRLAVTPSSGSSKVSN